MSVVQGGTDIGLANLTSEFKKLTEGNDSVSNIKENELVASDKEQVAITTKTAEEVNQQPLTVQQLEKVAQQLQDFVGDMNRGLVFSVDKDSGRDVIKVIDKNSGELIKQFPSEEVLTLVAKLSEMVGGFIDAKV
ncbi:flagellar protein FlaG [Colwellia piezophila]|uniref:flagellar protein FlaG n=1 Tax=Colwellia piezophila TaxID=211668 RepID=UPI0003804422|nr:flagellar protein FlaG [Colwellia piezophila]